MGWFFIGRIVLLLWKKVGWSSWDFGRDIRLCEIEIGNICWYGIGVFVEGLLDFFGCIGVWVELFGLKWWKWKGEKWLYLKVG